MLPRIPLELEICVEDVASVALHPQQSYLVPLFLLEMPWSDDPSGQKQPMVSLISFLNQTISAPVCKIYEHLGYYHSVGILIIPTDELTFFG